MEQTKKAPMVRIECKPIRASDMTIGETIKGLWPQIDDIVIAAADKIIEQMDLDFDDSCIKFADCYAVGKEIVDRIRELPSEWDGTSWLTLSPAEKDTVSVDQTGNTNALPLAEIACARLRNVSDCDETDTLRAVMVALIQAS